jgi:hypothetical protein
VEVAGVVVALRGRRFQGGSMSVERSAVIVMVAIGLASLLLVYAVGTSRVSRKAELGAAIHSTIPAEARA